MKHLANASNTTGDNTTPAVARYPLHRALRALVALTRPHLKLFVVGLLALASGSLINLLLPELVRRILDPQRFDWVTANLTTVVLGIGVLFLVQGGASFIRSYLLGLLGQRVYTDLRERLFTAVLSHDIAFFDRNRSSELAARINSDAALVQEAVSTKLSVIIRYTIQVVLGVVLMLCMSLKLTAAIVLSVLIIVASSMLFVTRLRQSSRDYQDERARFASFASEAFGGVKIVRAFGALGQLLKRAQNLNARVLECGEGRVLLGAAFSSGISALLNLLLLCVVWFGISLVLGGELPLNELAAFVLYGAIVAVSFSFLVGAYTDLLQGLGGLERVLQLIEPSNFTQNVVTTESQRLVTNGGTKESPAEASSVVFNGVTFAYPARVELAALRGLSCTIESGSCTAFVGPSGSGKSTLVQLLCKFYAPQEGVITLDGVSLADVSDEVVRRRIAWVPQDATLFGFSVLDNLLLGNVSLTREEAINVVREWPFLDFVQTLKSGFDTALGEQGALLSGGQRQRLAIARAMLRKPALLLLDEATSGLDSETESEVMCAIREYLPQTTLVVISHRLSSVKDADRIYVLEDGVVVESGTHNELSTRAGLYQQYAERQSLD